MSPSKNYQLLRYLNRQHNIVERSFFTVLGFFGCLCITQHWVLARHLSRIFWHDHFKDGMRLAYWYTCRSWLPIGKPGNDPFFVVVDGMTLSECQAFQAWLDQRSGKLPQVEYAVSSLFAMAQVVHEATAQKNVRQGDYLDQFCLTLNTTLKDLIEKRTQAQSSPISQFDKTTVNDREGDFARDDAEVALLAVSDLLPIQEWRWCTLSGTFLGLYREGDFLAHDFDIDLGLKAESTNITALVDILENSTEFQSVETTWQRQLQYKDKQWSLISLPVLVKAVHKNGIAVDFSILYQEKGYFWHGSMMHRWEHLPWQWHLYQLRDVEVFGPFEADRYLTEAYGDWQTPVKSFNCSSGRHNLMVAPNLLSVALFLRRLAWHLEQQDIAGFDNVLAQMSQQNLICDNKLNLNWFSS